MANGLTHRTKPAAPRKIRGFGSGMEEENADKCKGHWLGVEGRGLGNTESGCPLGSTASGQPHCVLGSQARGKISKREGVSCTLWRINTSSIFCLSQILPLSVLKGLYLGLSQQWRMRQTVLFIENSYWFIFQTTVENNIKTTFVNQLANRKLHV